MDVQKMMKALSIADVTAAEHARLVQVPVPEVRPGWALVRIRGFGLNHSELELRRSEIRAAYIKKPVIPGIECVGEIAEPSDSGWKAGQKVVALMGGMGRSWDGSYAQSCLAPASHLFTIPDVAKGLPWQTLAAIPETYFTAWGSLFEGLRLEPLDTLLVECQRRIAAQQERGTRTFYYKKDHLWKLLEWEQGTLKIPTDANPHAFHDGCHCGRGHLTILPTGIVYACRRMESPVGDIARESLASIYLGKRMDAYRDISGYEKCATCPLHGWCRGCPAVAFGYTGDRYAPDPQCWWTPKQ